jgi:hypothetical protein
VAGAHCLLDDGGRDVDEAELRAAEQSQRAVAGDIAPDQTEVAVCLVAPDRRAGEVVAVIGTAAGGDVDLPADGFAVAGERLGGHTGHTGDGQRRRAGGDSLGDGAEGDVDVLVHGAVGFGVTGEAGKFGSLDDDGHRAEGWLGPGRPTLRFAGGRRGVLVVRPCQPVPDLVVYVGRRGERDPHRCLAEIPRLPEPTFGPFDPVETQAEIDPAFRRRLQHRERAAGRDQGDERAARLDRNRAGERGDDCEYRVEDRPQLWAVGVLLADEFFVLDERCFSGGRGGGGRRIAGGGGGAAAEDLGAKLRPAREAVLAGDGELSGGQRPFPGDRADAADRVFIAGVGRAQQFAGLTAQLIQIGAAGKIGHGSSPSPARVRVRLRDDHGARCGHICRLVVKVDSVLPADPEAPSNADVSVARQ